MVSVASWYAAEAGLVRGCAYLGRRPGCCVLDLRLRRLNPGLARSAVGILNLIIIIIIPEIGNVPLFRIRRSSQRLVLALAIFANSTWFA